MSKRPASYPTRPATPLTARGRQTRARIVEGAALLMYERGVAGTSLDDVRGATSTSKSQLYHYFGSKSDLVCAVIAYQQAAVMAGQQPFLGDFSTLAGLRAWRNQIIAVNGASLEFGGCPIGGLSSEVSHVDELARSVVMTAFESWCGQLTLGLSRMRESGELPLSSDPAALAWGLLAAVQGGLLLAQAAKQIAPLEAAIDHAISVVEALAKDASRRPRANSRSRAALGRP